MSCLVIASRCLRDCWQRPPDVCLTQRPTRPHYGAQGHNKCGYRLPTPFCGESCWCGATFITAASYRLPLRLPIQSPGHSSQTHATLGGHSSPAPGPKRRRQPVPNRGHTPTQPTRTNPPKSHHPGQAAVCKRYAAVAPKPKRTITHPSGPPNTAPQPPTPPPPPPAQLPVTHSDDYIWEEAKLAITDHAAPPTLHRLAPSLQGWRTGLIRYNDLQPPAVPTSSFTTPASSNPIRDKSVLQRCPHFSISSEIDPLSCLQTMSCGEEAIQVIGPTRAWVTPCSATSCRNEM